MNKFSSMLICSLFALSAVAAEEFATAEDARAMLERAVAALKADKVKALEAFNRESGDFRDRDLYVFCGTPDGRYTAHPKLAEMNLKGRNLRDAKDTNGQEIGKEMLAKAKEGKIASINYMYQRPGSDKAVPKEVFVTRVGDQLCGTAYYKQQL